MTVSLTVLLVAGATGQVEVAIPLGPTTRLAPEIAKSVVSPASDQVIAVLSPPVGTIVVTTVPAGARQATLGFGGEKVKLSGAVTVIVSVPFTLSVVALRVALTSAACAGQTAKTAKTAKRVQACGNLQ